MIRVAVSGAAGRMGHHVLLTLEGHAETQVAGALEARGHPRLGELVSGVRIVDDPGEAIARAEVVIDFSVPDASIRVCDAAAKRGIPAVVGTTGFDAEQLSRIEEVARKVPLVLAANFSLGVNVLLELVTEAARLLHEYDAEVLELHHAAKVDAPSGTALRLAGAIAEARGLRLEDHQTLHREGETGARPKDAIGIQSLRGGDAVGDHTVFLAGPGERIELTHRALSRDNFAAGSVRAALWALCKPPGLYSMRDVLSRSPSAP